MRRNQSAGSNPDYGESPLVRSQCTMGVMSRVVFLIGTSHNIQFGLDQPDEFYNCVVDACQAHAVRAVAEESNAECLALFNVSETVPGRAAKSLGLHHLHCDPISEKRKEIGVVERNQ